MAAVDAGHRQSRDVLPSISHLDLDKIKTDRGDISRYPIMNGLSVSTAPLGSPTTIYSGPPPPYSCASSTTGSTQGLSGYISPPESTTRRSTRDDKESPGVRKSLPSIQEALGDKSMQFPAALSASNQHQIGSTPSTAVCQSFPDAPKGPSNPFSQPTISASSLRETPYSNQPASNGAIPNDLAQFKSTAPPSSTVDSRPPVSQSYIYPGSPRSTAPAPFRSSALPNTSFQSQPESSSAPSPLRPDQPRQSYPFPPIGNPSGFSHVNEPFQFASGSKFDEQRASYPRATNEMPYGDTVKRHLDVFDAELGLNEISEASNRTLDFSRIWAQRYHQSNRSSFYPDALPGVTEIEDMMRQSQRVMENLGRIRDVVIAQQNALTEQRARLARGNQIDDEYNGLSDEYKGGGFAGGDAKKRRGKAAPPGRCHSCNRAETPEWRRGPDGARTLCNACGLHYAKLTRKMGHNKAVALTGSNLRPKNLDQRS